jgi:hypothetical protein
MITIAKYRNLMAAELVKTRLESRGIKTMIADEFSYTLGYGSVIDGVRLQVAEEDAGRAKKILAADEYIDLPDDSTVISESPESATGNGETAGESVTGNGVTARQPGAGSSSVRPGAWPVWLLFLSGVFFLILGRAAGNPRIMSPHSGHVILIGEILIVAGLWILYDRLNPAGENEKPPE